MKRFALYFLAGWGLLFWIGDLALQIALVRLTPMADPSSYTFGGSNLLAGRPIYAAFQLAGPYRLIDAANGHGFMYPPTAALLFAPLGTSAWTVVVLAAWAAFAAMAYRVALGAYLKPQTALVVAAVVAISGPAINAASSGNVNLLVADALLASWLWPRSAGYLAVLGGLIKLFPAAGLVWALRKGGSALGPVAIGLVIVAVTTAFVGIGGWHDFLVALANGRSSSWYLVPSPIQALGPGIGTVVGYAAAGLALVGVWRIRSERVAFALLGWAMILPAPDWWSHYLLVPLAAILPFAVGRLAQASEARKVRQSPAPATA